MFVLSALAVAKAVALAVTALIYLKIQLWRARDMLANYSHIYFLLCILF